MSKDPEKALDKLAKETQDLGKGLEAELKEDLEKAKGSGAAEESPADDERDE